MKPPIQDDIIALLRARREPVRSRDLAERFLRIAAADEETCRRLLAPILTGVPGVTHAAGDGWRFDPPAGTPGRAGTASRPTVAPAVSASPAPAGKPPVVESPAWEEPDGSQSLEDFVALAVDGVGPGGSGAPRALTFLPVVDGEELQDEHLPSGGLDEEGFTASFDDLEESPGTGRRPPAALSDADLAALVEAIGDLPIVTHRAGREVEPLRRLALSIGLPFHPRVISAARLGHLLLGLKANHAAAEMSKALGIETTGPDDCRGRARMVARAYLALLPRLREKRIDSVDALLEFQNLPAEPIDLAGRRFTHDDLRALPSGPGVYRFLDREGALLYIGKARHLRTRVGSYFAPSARGTAKGRAILEQTDAIAIETVGSELEAILLEAALLQEHRPPLNRQFDVHERPAPYGPRRNLVVVLKDAGGPTCTLHLMQEGRYHRRCAGVDPDADDGGWAQVRGALESAYASGAAAPPGGDLDWALVSTYLKRHDDAVQVLDVDEAPALEAAEERLRVLARGALAGAGKLVAR